MSGYIYKQIPSKINIPTTILDLLKGTNDLWLQNRIFIRNDKDDRSNKELFKGSIINCKTGSMLKINAPKLYIKNEYGKFVNNYNIELTSRLKNSETYRFARPSEITYQDKLAKKKNVIRTKIVDREAETNALIQIDNIVYMSLEFLLLANAVNYDFSKCVDDKELINGLFKAISPTHNDKLTSMLSDKYFDIINNPPLWEKDNDIMGNFKLVNEDEAIYLSLFNLIYATKAGDKKKILPNSLQEDIVKNIFKGKCKGNILFEFIMSTSSNDIVPMFKRVQYDINDSIKVVNDIRLTWWIKEEHAKDYSPTFPTNMYTKIVKRSTEHIINGAEFMKMIGYGDVDETVTYYKGFMWVTHNSDLNKYGKYQAHSCWYVSKVILNKTEYKRPTLEIDDEYYANLEDVPDDSKPTNEPLQQTFISAEQLAKDFDDI